MPHESKQNIEKQQDIENKHGRALLDLLGIKFKLKSGKPPAPDLLFRHEGRRIGVEDTRLFAEDGSAKRTPQARKTLVDEIAAETQLEYEKSGLPPVEVLLNMRRCDIKSANVKALSDQIVDVVRTNSTDYVVKGFAVRLAARVFISNLSVDHPMDPNTIPRATSTYSLSIEVTQ